MRKIYFLFMGLICVGFSLTSCKSTNQSNVKADLTILGGEDEEEKEVVQFEVFTGVKNKNLKIYGRGKVGGEVKLFQLDENEKEIPVSFKALVSESPSSVLNYDFFLEVVRDFNSQVAIPGQFYLGTRQPHKLKDYHFKNLSSANYVGMIKDKEPVKICFEDDSCDAVINLKSKPASIQITYHATDISKLPIMRPTPISTHRLTVGLNYRLLLNQKKEDIVTPIFFGSFQNNVIKVDYDPIVAINGQNFKSDAFESELDALKKLDEVLGSSSLVVQFQKSENPVETAYSRQEFKDKFVLKNTYEVEISD